MSENSPHRTTVADDDRFARFLYRWRWPLAAAALVFVFTTLTNGVGRIDHLGASLTELRDVSDGSGAIKPMVFDPSLDVWFGQGDEAVTMYYEIENRFIAEDYIMVTFEADDGPFGVFDREALSTIARLTESFQTIPGVRHVRSLTQNPWIRWGRIEDERGDEEGLLISDLVTEDPAELTDAQIVERMIAVLGAERTAARVGEPRVRQVIGSDADLGDYLGEPLVLGTILNERGTATTIQVQVLRPRVSAARLDEVYGDDNTYKGLAPNLFAVQSQLASIRGIEHFLRAERGLAVQTPAFKSLLEAIDAMPASEARDERLVDSHDPSRNFVEGMNGEQVRKFFEYDAVAGVGFADLSGPGAAIPAPASFVAAPLSPYAFHLGGVPLFERNFEVTGMADAKYIPLMFLVIIFCLALAFRNLLGVVAPLAVVLGSILGVVGGLLWKGDLFNNLTIMAPNMLTAVGIGDAIHLTAAWAMLRGSYATKRELITEVIRQNALPVFLTSVTTAIGFFSLTVSRLEPVTMLGYTAGLGTILAYALSMAVVPALLSLAPHSAPTAGAAAKPGLVARLFSPERSRRLVEAVTRNRRAILAGAAALLVVSAVGLARVEIDSDFRAMFPDDNPTMSDFRWIEGKMGGVGDVEIVFAGAPLGDPAPPLSADDAERLEQLQLQRLGASEARDEFAALSPGDEAELIRLEDLEVAWNASRIGVSTAFLGSLDRFETRLVEEMADASSPLHIVTDLQSPLDILRKVHQVQNKNRASFYRVPVEEDVSPEARDARLAYDSVMEEWDRTPAQDGSRLIAQYYLQYESGAKPGENLTTQLTADRTQLRMQGRILQAGSTARQAAFARIENIAAEEFPELLASVRGEPVEGHANAPDDALASVTVSGKSLLFARTTRLFTLGFMQSMAIALVTITVLIGLIFRSFRLALVSLIPNVLPIVIPLSAFGLMGRTLDGPAVLVSSVALGVCVDDTIHFFTKFMAALRDGKSTEEALAYVFVHTGAALTLTTMTLVIGFSTLLLSDFSPNFQMGALATFMIGLAWVADFLVTTAVLSYWPTAATAPDDALREQSGQRVILAA